MADETRGDQNIQADNNSIAFGGISVGGNVGDIRIGHTIGFTSDQVSTLITQISTTFQVKPFDGRCPYKGLEVFGEEDAELFFGREKWVENLVSRVQESRTLFVTGQSGSGKSSLVRAGLIPTLKKASYGEGWLYAILKPGRDPIEALAGAFSRLKDPSLGKYLRENAAQTSALHECAESVLTERADQRLVLFLDQFEEVFTQLSKDKAQTFINLLAHVATVENGRVIILFSMRSDFVPNCATYPQLNELLNQQFVQIGAMQPEELVSAIAQPALRVGLKIDPDLIAQIINDMKGEPGALPLMQFALKDLFDAEQAKGGMIALTRSDYLEHGGINEALERHANASLATLTDDEKELARNVFSGLIEIGRGTQDTRRTALSNELIPAGAQAEAVKTVVQKLANARLITTDAATVTISHEKLIDAWPWLKKLVNENRDVIALQNEIAEDAKEWEEHKRDSSYLYSGARLINANEQLKANKLVLSGTALEYIRTGQAQQRRGRAALISGVLALLITFITAAVVFRNQAQKFELQATIARAGELAAQSTTLVDSNAPNSLLLAIEAYRTFVNMRTKATLFDITSASPQLRQIIAPQNDTSDIAFSPDRKTLASSSHDGTLTLWNINTGLSTGQLHFDGIISINSISYSPDGKTLAVGGCGELDASGNCSKGEITLWDTSTQQSVRLELPAESNNVTDTVFSPDGNMLVSFNFASAILWNLAIQPITGKSIDWQGPSISESMALSPDGKSIAIGDAGGNVHLLNAEDLQPSKDPFFHDLGAVISDVAFSPDGKTLISRRDIGTITLWDVTTGQPAKNQLNGYPVSSAVVFSPDGQLIASGNTDGTINIWAEYQPFGQPLTGYAGGVNRVVFSPDSKTLASLSAGTIFLWDINATEEQQIGERLSGYEGLVTRVAFPSDSKILVAVDDFDTIKVWDVSARTQIGKPRMGRILAFSADGDKFASYDLDSTITLEAIASGDRIGKQFTTTSYVTHGVLSPDGKDLAFQTSEGIVLWNSLTGKSVTLRENGYLVGFSYDSKTLILFSDSNNREIALREVETGERIGEPIAGTVVALSPDGKILASTNDDGMITLWDAATGKRLGEPLIGARENIVAMAFSPDGQTLAFNNGKSITLLDVAGRQSIAQLDAPPYYSEMSFSPDSSIFTASGVSSSTFWNMKTQRWITDLPRYTAVSPKGEILATINSAQDTLTLWDTATGQPLGQPIKGFYSSNLDFSPDGKLLAVGMSDEVFLMDLDPEAWIKRSCQRAGRNFTRDEWQRYGFTEPYRKTCEQWPPEPEVVVTPTATP